MFGTGVHKREIDDITETNYQANSIRTQSNSLCQELVHIEQETNFYTALDYLEDIFKLIFG